ncbi:MAG TPA: response regulator [Candidatus Obscuribacterales bacterium]
MGEEKSQSDEFLTSLSQILRQRRQHLGMSQEELAESSGLHRTYISEVERGARNPSAKCLFQLASALQMSVSEMMTAAEALQAALADPLQVLLVEDHPADVHLIMTAIKECKIPCRVSVASDGVEALAYLRGIGQYKGAPRPEIVLLDLNLPKLSGFEVLSEMKSRPDLVEVPVVVISTSEKEDDIKKTYRLHGNCFITKPIDLEEFFRVVGQTLEFWFSTVRRPLKAR